jgi:hypothetical protein
MEPKYYGAAAEYNKPSGFQFNRKFLLIGLVAIVVITAMLVTGAVITSLNAGPGRDLATLIARQSALQSILEKNKDQIKNADLRKANADTNLFLASNTVALTPYLLSIYSLKTIPLDISSRESSATDASDLKQAAQVGKFDTTYIGFVRTKLASVLGLAQKVLDEVGNQNLKTDLQAAINAIQNADDQLAALVI